MKAIKIFISLALVAGTGLGSLAFINKKPLAASADKGFAVVELFTSEGCSSCPPADEVIAKINKEMKDQPVYILAYHVDYWNRLGWKDVFSSADYSRRQNTYANWFKLSSVYTPQVVVNGQSEFVGSEEGTLRNAISAGLRRTGQANLSLTDLKVNHDDATVTYHADAAAGNTLVVALVKNDAHTVVKAGENKGRTLSHVQIVTNFQNIPLQATSGEAKLKLPADFSAKQFELIAFVQNNKTGVINAATRVAL